MYLSFIDDAAKRIRGLPEGATKNAAMDALVNFDRLAVGTRRALGGQHGMSTVVVTEQMYDSSELSAEVRDALNRSTEPRDADRRYQTEVEPSNPQATVTPASAPPVHRAHRMRFALAVSATAASFLVSLWLILFVGVKWNLSQSDLGVLAGVLGSAAAVASVVIAISMPKNRDR